MDAVIQFSVTNQIIERIDHFSVVADSIDYLQAKFNFLTDEWEQGAVTAQFRNSTNGITYEVLLDENDMCTVPHEVLAMNGGIIYVSCFTGMLVTASAASVYVKKSGYDGDASTSQPPTPSVYEQIIDRMDGIEDAVEEATERTEAAADKAEEALEHYPKIEDGFWYVWDVADEEWSDTGVDAHGLQGEKGDQGIPGKDGADGRDGISPTVTITNITGGHRISITDRNGTKTADVMDGAKGEKGDQGVAGKDGVDGVGIAKGGTTGQVLAKSSNSDYDTEWVNQSGGGGGGTSDYNSLVNRPYINSVLLTGNRSLSDLGIAAISDIPDVSGLYTKPSSGIPKSDMSSSVQTSLGKADTALQEHQSLEGYATETWVGQQGYGTYSKPSGGIPDTDLSYGVQTSLGKADTAVQSETDPVFTASAAYGISSSDISAWNGKSDFSGSYNDLTDKPTIPILQNVFGIVKVGSTNVEADSTRDTLELIAGENVNLIPNASNDSVKIEATDTTYESKQASSGGADVSLVTTGEKYTWNNKSDFSGSYNDLSNKPSLAAVATSGSYSDLSNKPSIPTITDTYDGTSSDGMSGKAVKSAIDALDATVSGSVGTGKTLTAFSQTDGKVSATFGDISITKSQVSDFPTLATVATSGSYADLSNKPTIPTVTDTYSGTSSDGMSGKAVKSAIDALDGTVSGSAGSSKTLTAFSQTDGKVSATFGDISITKSQVSDFPTLATVATSGSYSDLSNKPSIPSTASDVGAIAAPSSPATGAFLVYNGSAWVAQTLATWQGGSY